MAETLIPPHSTADEPSWEEALEEAINLFEQGESMNQARFAELVEELKQRKAETKDLTADDPRLAMMASLRERAAKLEASAAQGTGPTDQVSSLLGALVGQPAHTDAPAIVEVEGVRNDD